MHFPSWRYHATEKPIVVNDPIEDEALGLEWADTPAAFDAVALEPVEDGEDLEDDENEGEPEPQQSEGEQPKPVDEKKAKKAAADKARREAKKAAAAE